MTSRSALAVPAARRKVFSAQLAAAVAVSFLLHASAALVVAATPERSAGGGSNSARAPLQTRLAADAREGASAAVPTQAATGKAEEAGAPPPARGSASGIYFKRSQLDAHPYLVTRVEPRYPAGGPPNGGRARIRLFINERGFVDRVAVVESAPHVRFGEAAADAFRAAQFAPGKRGGNAVKSQIVIEMAFPPLVPKTAK